MITMAIYQQRRSTHAGALFVLCIGPAVWHSAAASKNGATPGAADIYRTLQDDEASSSASLWPVQVTYVSSAASGPAPPPRSTHVYHPAANGTFKPLLFQHGAALRATDYSQLLMAVAANGVIVVAPQMYTPGPLGLLDTSVEQEELAAFEMQRWVGGTWPPSGGGGLQAHLPAGLTVDSALGLVVAGHSRGANVAFLTAKDAPPGARLAAVPPLPAILGLVGLDPVDSGFLPKTLGSKSVLAKNESYPAGVVPDAFPFRFPTLVIGTGLGPLGAVPCAPEGYNHVQFFAECPPPSYHVVLSAASHMSVLNDRSMLPLQDRILASACKKATEVSNGQIREVVSIGILIFLQQAYNLPSTFLHALSPSGVASWYADVVAVK